MTENRLRNIFYLLALVLLIAMLIISRDAGISGDEEVHYRHSVLVFNYFSSLGQDQSAVHTPETHLQYYGQIFDNLVTILIKWFNIGDIYAFRHLMCSLAGWLTIFITALFAARFSGYGASVLVLILFAASPTFLGHAQNNLKDIPFALAYISSIYFSFKLIFSDQKISKRTVFWLVLSLALSFGIRPGGLLSILYVGFFSLTKAFIDWQNGNRIETKLFRRRIPLFAGIALSGYFLALIAWPFALQNPLVNPWKSYEVMTNFPTTVRQIFEGQLEWSDFLPWYYLPKYLLITIPLIIWAGIVLFLTNSHKNYRFDQKVQLALLGFTTIFPIIFVILKQSNLYGSWRHFLFIYPGIVLFSALGLQAIYLRFKKPVYHVLLGSGFLFLILHPLKFMVSGYPYFYLYYNQTTNGLKGAYGNFETDYYYHTMRSGAEWLQDYLKNKPSDKEIIVGGNFPAQWYFRNDKSLKFHYFQWQKRSESDWDYAIIANSYISPFQLKNRLWPPKNTIHTVSVDGIPVCAVIERLTKDDFEAIQEQINGNYIKSVLLFEKALQNDSQNELILYKFAQVLLSTGQREKASEILAKCLSINPDYEPALMLAGDEALLNRDRNKAIDFYERTIRANRKFYSVYPKLAQIYAETDVAKARKILMNCLRLNSKYKPAIAGLADTYRKTDPAKAKKYDRIILNLE